MKLNNLEEDEIRNLWTSPSCTMDKAKRKGFSKTDANKPSKRGRMCEPLRYMDWEEHIDREEFADQIRNLKGAEALKCSCGMSITFSGSFLGECKAKHSYTVAMNLKKLDARLIEAFPFCQYLSSQSSPWMSGGPELYGHAQSALRGGHDKRISQDWCCQCVPRL